MSHLARHGWCRNEERPVDDRSHARRRAAAHAVPVQPLTATALGLLPEGRLRDHVFTNGRGGTPSLYSILTHEWKAA